MSELERALSDHCCSEDESVSQTKELGQSLEATRGQETDLSSSLQKGRQPVDIWSLAQ